MWLLGGEVHRDPHTNLQDRIRGLLGSGMLLQGSGVRRHHHKDLQDQDLQHLHSQDLQNQDLQHLDHHKLLGDEYRGLCG